MSSILDTIRATIAAFGAAGLEPPEVIHLAKPEDGIRLLSEIAPYYPWPPTPKLEVNIIPPLSLREALSEEELNQPVELQKVGIPHPAVTSPVDLGGKDYAEAKVFGVIVRWPARAFITERGEAVWT